MKSHPIHLTILVLVLLATACSGPRKVIVTGSVPLDGAPLPEGEIHFTASNNSHPVVVGVIKAGKYQVSVPIGPKRVEIYASKPSNIDMGGGQTMPVQYLPARYNSESTLTAEVSPEKKQFDFTLTSDPQPTGS